jgi:hypothetical protein
MNEYSTLEEVRRKDPTAYRLIGRAGLDTLVIALANEKAALMKRVGELELIAPRKMRWPDGSVRVYRAPEHLLPDPPPFTEWEDLTALNTPRE